jgi:hypothetical protein
MADIHPWYAHEFPDRPLAEGAFLCCCVPCAVSLERAGQDDAHRPIVFHTGWGTRTWYAGWTSMHRGDQGLHDMVEYLYLGAGPGNWVKAVTVGARHGRGKRGWEPEGPYPRPLEEWPVCTHCGPLSTATFAQLVDFGAKPRRRTAKFVAAEEASRVARAELVSRVQEVSAMQREVGMNLWRHPVVVPDFLPDEADDW